jgi:hypothetical protein
MVHITASAMEILNIENTPKTPSVKFNGKQGKLEVKGRSIPENSVEFYRPLIDCLGLYASNPVSPTEVDFQLEYFNTSSSKCIINALKVLETIHKNGTEVIINWHYEDGDDDMKDSGEDLQVNVSLPFNFKKI